MKNFIKDYLKIIAYTVIGLVFMVNSFYLMMNYYHNEELKTPLYVPAGDLTYQNYQTKLSQISNSLNNFNSKKVTNNNLRVVYNKLVTCKSVLESEGTLAKIKTNSYFYPQDVYKLGSKFQSDVLNVCWALHLSYLTDENVASEFKDIAPYVENSVASIRNQVNFALEEIQNNSSYFYTTNITSSTIRNYLSADYEIIADSYNEFANIVLELSTTINEKAREVM